MNKEGLECLRLLNEIIADFDEVQDAVDTLTVDLTAVTFGFNYALKRCMRNERIGVELPSVISQTASWYLCGKEKAEHFCGNKKKIPCT